MIITLISTSGGILLVVIGWLLGGKQKAYAEVKKTNADATVTIQGMFDTFALQYEKQYNAVLLQVGILQNQVADLNLRNAILTEASENWEQKFKDLEIESNSRSEKFVALQKEHDSLKKAFDSLKKSMK